MTTAESFQLKVFIRIFYRKKIVTLLLLAMVCLWLSNYLLLLALLSILCTTNFLQFVWGSGNGRYLGIYTTLPLGITFIETYHVDSGPTEPNTKWQIECMDQQGLVGLKDTNNDFGELQTVKCRTIFHEKAPTHGIYPFYDRCRLHNLTAGDEDYFCFNPNKDPNTINSFVTALWDDDQNFRIWVIRIPKTRSGTAFKCCGVPPGYYIDYTSCRLIYTHDPQWEYYDLYYFTVECPENYVMTGIGLAENPYDEEPHYDWIQCCAVIYAPFFEPQQLAHVYGAPFDVLYNLTRPATTTAKPTTSSATTTTRKPPPTTAGLDSQAVGPSGLPFSIVGTNTTAVHLNQRAAAENLFRTIKSEMQREREELQRRKSARARSYGENIVNYMDGVLAREENLLDSNVDEQQPFYQDNDARHQQQRHADGVGFGGGRSMMLHSIETIEAESPPPRRQNFFG